MAIALGAWGLVGAGGVNQTHPQAHADARATPQATSQRKPSKTGNRHRGLQNYRDAAALPKPLNLRRVTARLGHAGGTFDIATKSRKLKGEWDPAGGLLTFTFQSTTRTVRALVSRTSDIWNDIALHSAGSSAVVRNWDGEHLEKVTFRYTRGERSLEREVAYDPGVVVNSQRRAPERGKQTTTYTRRLAGDISLKIVKTDSAGAGGDQVQRTYELAAKDGGLLRIVDGPGSGLSIATNIHDLPADNAIAAQLPTLLGSAMAMPASSRIRAFAMLMGGAFASQAVQPSQAAQQDQ